MRINLGGNDWTLKGYWPNEWRLDTEDAAHPWQFGPVTPALQATVPGCVHADLIRHGLIRDPRVGLASLDCEWVAHRHWLYEKRFDAPAGWGARHVRLRFEGLEYASEILLNGSLVAAREGTFLPAEFDISDHLRYGEQNTLQVVVWDRGDDQSQIGYASRIREIRSRFVFHWDFSTRLVPLGIWDDVSLLVTDTGYIDTLRAITHLADGAGALNLEVDIRGVPGDGVSLEAVLSEGETWIAGRTEPVPAALGESVHMNVELTVPSVKPWWPNGCGPQNLYGLRLRLIGPEGAVSDETERRVGFRQLDYAQNESATRGSLPYCVLINGRRIYIKGVNWVPCDQLFGSADRRRYEWLLRQARDAHVNMVRVWGGGLIEKACFYELCDELGLMVWQEFPQSSSGLDNAPPADPAFISELRRVAESAVIRRRDHVCLTFWGGGNELRDAQGPLDETHPNIAALAAVCRRLDPDRCFLPASPSGPSFGLSLDEIGNERHHDVHGPWRYLGEKHYTLLNLSDSLLHSEVGAPGCACVRSLKRFIPADALWPPTADNPHWLHHGKWWVPGEEVKEFFGPLRTISDVVRASQFLQMEAVRYAAEANRRRKFENCGTLIWVLNEPWPNAANLSLIDYYGCAKPALDALRHAYAPRHVGLRHAGLVRKPGELFAAKAYGLSSLGALPDCRLAWAARTLDGDTIASGEEETPLPDNGISPAVGVALTIPDELPGGVFFVTLALMRRDVALARNLYPFVTGEGEAPLRPLLMVPATKLELVRGERIDAHRVRAEVRNTGPWPALWVRWESATDDLSVSSRESGATLWPGESATFELSLWAEKPCATALTLRAWNGPELSVKIQR